MSYINPVTTRQPNIICNPDAQRPIVLPEYLTRLSRAEIVNQALILFNQHMADCLAEALRLEQIGADDEASEKSLFATINGSEVLTRLCSELWHIHQQISEIYETFIFAPVDPALIIAVEEVGQQRADKVMKKFKRRWQKRNYRT